MTASLDLPFYSGYCDFSKYARQVVQGLVAENTKGPASSALRPHEAKGPPAAPSGRGGAGGLKEDGEVRRGTGGRPAGKNGWSGRGRSECLKENGNVRSGT